MLQYVNSFACATNEKQNNLVIHFRQNEPVITESDNEITYTLNPIVSLVMDEECAHNLTRSLLQLFPINSTEE